MIAFYHKARWVAGVLIVSPAIAYLLFLFVFPLIRLSSISLGEDGFSLSAYWLLFGDWSYADTLLRTFRISIIVVFVCIFFGYPLGYILAFATPQGRALLSVLIVLPFWTSVLVRNFSWVFLLKSDGLVSSVGGLFVPGSGGTELLYNEAGVIIGMANTLLPFMVFPIYVSIASQKLVLREAALSLGASPTRVFTRITLPLSWRGIATGSLMVFTTAIGFFITPALLGGGRVLTAATFISHQVQDFINWPIAAAAAVILLLSVLLLVIVFNRFFGERSFGAGNAAE